ncbi:hypothetical protein Arub01_18930 [Actinomadura rubrobrunea]|uniref:DUF2154 domain-containing protein n=1 Tax=Actinomadura rubrobrunea TaxID=115335 RepID=A0A9W6UU96_9ACTN|nr:hypothetical protein [Actinomadura rubrobrunea]GLW63649.1 hypothetical protein Arub01_18930 [Actinomadura rubrobrunea]
MATFATAEGVREEHVVVARPTGCRTARLSFDNGLERASLRSDASAAGLMDARFGSPLPTVWAADANVHVVYPTGARLLRRPRPSAIVLSPSVTWALDFHGGVSHVDADLRGLDLRSVTLHSGAARLRLVLDAPAETRVIRLASVTDLRIERPAQVPVRLEAAKGITRVRLDDEWYGAVGGGLTRSTHDSDAPGYRLIIARGADKVTVTSS